MSGGNTQGERPGSYRGFELLPVHLYVLAHLKKAGVDYARMMARVSGLPLGLIEDAVSDLLELGLIERDSGSAIKRSKARFKKAFEVHKHHTYYRLSREGELFMRSLDGEWLEGYFNNLLPEGWRIVRALIGSRDLGEVGKKVEINWEALEELKVLRFITEKHRKTEFFKRLSEFLGI
jgi:predicted transcriptional regulator